MKRSEIFFGIAKIPLDFTMAVLAFLAAYQLRLVTEPIEGFTKPIDYSILPTSSEYLQFSIKLALVLIVIFIFGRMYSLKTTTRFSSEIRKSIVLCGVWAMAIVTYFFFTRTFPFSRLAIIYSWGLTLIFLVFGRLIIHYIQRAFLKSGIGKRRLAFIGSNNVTREIEEKLSKDASYKIIGTLNSLKELEEKAKKLNIEEIIQTKEDLSGNQNEDILEFCELNHIHYRFIPDLLEVRRTKNIDVETISGIPIISLKPTPLDGWGKVVKRFLDFFGAFFGMILLSPILLITALAIKIDSPGPILFNKLEDGTPVKRVGQKGRLFSFQKFRSMKTNTHSLRYSQLSNNNLRQDGPLVKIQNDPRITKIGKFLRKYSIDELPQLWNVFKGEMSLVGPRPHLPEEVAKYEKHHHFVFTIKPGLTGLAQISGRSDLSFEEETRLDRFYIENWSIWLDIKIMIKTLGVVLKGYKE